MMYVVLSIALYLLAFKVLDAPSVSSEGEESSSSQEPETSGLSSVTQTTSRPLQALRSSGSFQAPPK